MTNTLDSLFLPKSIAVIGASPKVGIPRNTLLRVLIKHGFEGNIYPVSRSFEEIEGLKAYPRVADLPETPDVALIITPAETVPEIVAECGEKGIRSAIVFSAGFDEVEEGKEIALRLAEAARKHNVKLLGPNCQGIWSVAHKAMMTYSPAANVLEKVEHAPIAIISQSGALAGAIAGNLHKMGMGVAYVASVGNESVLDLLEILEWMVEQNDVRAIALYIEGLNDAARITRIARRATERGVQIIALKAGSSAKGQEATASHTGKIASPHSIYQDVFEQVGVLSVNSILELLASVEAITYLPNPRGIGSDVSGVSVMSTSGGAGAMLADHSEKYHIPLAEFSDDTLAQLAEILPSIARKVNPVDFTGQIRGHENMFGLTCEALAKDPRTEAVVVQFASSGKRDLAEHGESFKKIAKDYALPVVIGFVAEKMDIETQRDFRKEGVLLTDDTSATMRTLSYIYNRRKFATRQLLATKVPLAVRAVPVTWAETMEFLDAAAVRAAKWVTMGPTETAAQACVNLTYPLVVKVLPTESDHKTELGLVKLKVASPEVVDGHAADFRKILNKPEMSVLIQEMIGEGVEAIISCSRNSDFGPVLSIGMGGVAVELFADITHLALPVTADEVRASLKKLKLWTLLSGFRGKPAADIEALVNAAVRFGDTFLATPGIQEIEINPVIVRPEGEGVYAVDALISAN